MHHTQTIPTKTQSNNNNDNTNPITDVPLKILYWNARSLNSHKEEISVIINEFDIFACVESWLQKDQEIKFSGYKCYRRDRNDNKGGGIAIYIKKNIEFTEITNINEIENVEICGIKVTNTTPELNLIVCYRTPKFNLSQVQWNEITKTALSSDSHCLLLGDFNAHHTMWNCSHNDPNGEKFLKSIIDNELFIHNIDTLSHVDYYRNKKSNLDLVISNKTIADKINFEINDET